MEIIAGRTREYILALKEAGNFKYEDIANQSGIPVQTIRNICSGKTIDSGFDTIAKIVITLGGDLNELVGYEKKKEARSVDGGIDPCGDFAVAFGIGRQIDGGMADYGRRAFVRMAVQHSVHAPTRGKIENGSRLLRADISRAGVMHYVVAF